MNFRTKRLRWAGSRSQMASRARSIRRTEALPQPVGGVAVGTH